MDALALLCTLYAEGPATLARLRQVDCTTIESVLATDPRALASILMATEATAERFQREARSLGDRVGMPEAGPGPYGARPPQDVHARPAVLDRVLAAWRERDEHDTDDARDRRFECADTSSEREEILQPAILARATTESRGRDARATRILAVGAVDGLDGEVAAALARAGVRDLSALAMCDTLLVARASGLSWSRLNRLRALAARVPGIVAIVAAAKTDEANDHANADSEEKISPSERPLIEHEGLTQLELTPQSMTPTMSALRSSTASIHTASIHTASIHTAPIHTASIHTASIHTAPIPISTTAPHYARHAPEGAGGPFA